MHEDVAADTLSWDVLYRFAQSGGLTKEGGRAVEATLQGLRELLGPSWPRRQHAAFRGLPDELLLFANHSAALPQFLNLGTRLQAAASEPTFKPVLTDLRRGLAPDKWRHLLLQLEVARAGRAIGMRARFEPPIPNTVRYADVLLDGGPGEALLVETTSLFRSDIDIAHQTYESNLGWSLMEIEQRRGVYITTRLTDHLNDDDTNAWLRAVDSAAQDVRHTDTPQSIRRAAGEMIVDTRPPTTGTTTFSGAVQRGDGWRRLARTLDGKVRQMSGTTAAWIRVDVLDGFFQFTDWGRKAWPERVNQLALALNDALGEARHIAGVVVSSGLATSLGAVDSAIEDITVTTARGTGLRRLVAQQLVRETVIIPLQPAASQQLAVWTDSYNDEPFWLDEDLHSRGLSPLAALWQK